MAKILVLGTDHTTQQKGLGDFTAKLKYLIAEFAVQIIFEEWLFQKTNTAGCKIANSNVPSLPWRNVGTPETRQYQTLRAIFSQLTTPQFWIYQYGPLNVQNNREQYMLSKIGQEMQSKNVGLFICGYAHLHSMCDKLESMGFEVKGFF